MRIEKQYRFLLTEQSAFYVIVAGVGGTGSQLAMNMARLAHHAKLRNIPFILHLVDPDRVEQKNVGRQQFSPLDVGQNKAENMAGRLNRWLGLNVLASPTRFTGEWLRKSVMALRDKTNLLKEGHRFYVVVVGAVDSAGSREEIAQAVMDRRTTSLPVRGVWWVDCGNDADSGAVYVGNSGESKQKLSLMGLVSGIPYPHLQNPALVAAEPQMPLVETAVPTAVPVPAACVDLLVEQSLFVNQAVANTASHLIMNLVLNGRADTMAVHMALNPVGSRTTAVTESALLDVPGLEVVVEKPPTPKRRKKRVKS